MVNFLTAFGAVLLTFLAGAEIDPDSLRVHLRRRWRSASSPSLHRSRLGPRKAANIPYLQAPSIAT